MPLSPAPQIRLQALRVAGIYVLAAATWIIASDQTLTWLLPEVPPRRLAEWQTAKGIVFVAITALLLYWLVLRSLERQRAGQQQYQDLIERSHSGIFVQTDGIVRFINSAGIAFFGAQGAHEIVGRPVFDFIHPEAHALVRKRIDALHREQQAAPVMEHRFVRLDGREVSAEVIATPFSYDGRPAVQVMLRDLSEGRAYAERMAHLTHHDALTELPNMALLRDRIGQQIIHAPRLQRRIALVVFDVSGLHFINDTYGYDWGDRLLRAIAAELLTLVRQGDTVARIAGDEFAVLLTDLDDRAGLLIAIEKIRAGLMKNYPVAGEEVFITLHSGASVWPDDGQDADALIKNAVSAAWRAKREGDTDTAFYAQSISTESRRRVTLQRALAEAIGAEQFSLHYQPKIDARSGNIAGCEALIRWHSPTLGLVMPDGFIALAEETGSILPIGEWVLREACRQMAEWRGLGLGRIPVAVNLSARQLQHPGLSATIGEILQQHDIAADQLMLELTESMIMNNAARTIAALNRLQGMGLRLSLDDFGTGYSSFSYLRTFAVHQLKIDKTFVRELCAQTTNERIVQAIVAIGHTLGMEVVAEGVETPAQAELLRRLDCDVLQGYHFSRPLEAQAMTRLLQERPYTAGQPAPQDHRTG